MRIKLSENYPNQFWNSGTGLTLSKAEGRIVEVNEQEAVIYNALKQGILVPAEESEEVNITDAPRSDTIKEVVGAKAKEHNKESILKAKRKNK